MRIAEQEVRSLTPMTAGSRNPPLRVMLVEDHPLVRAAIRQTINVPGIEVIAEAGSAEEALDLIREHQPDVMLVDLELPGDLGDRPAGRADQLDGVALELLREPASPPPPLLFHADILSSEVSCLRGEVHFLRASK